METPFHYFAHVAMLLFYSLYFNKLYSILPDFLSGCLFQITSTHYKLWTSTGQNVFSYFLNAVPWSQNSIRLSSALWSHDNLLWVRMNINELFENKNEAADEIT